MKYIYVLELKFEDNDNFCRYFSTESNLILGYHYEIRKSANAGAKIRGLKILLDSNIEQELKLD